MDAIESAKSRYDEARKRLDEAGELAVKHNQHNYWVAYEAAAEDAAQLCEAYCRLLPEDERKRFEMERAEELLAYLSRPKNVFGGPQEGAGRPELPEDKRKQRLVAYVEPAVADWVELNGGSKFVAEILAKAHIEAHIV
jgi:hypothetical protein